MAQPFTPQQIRDSMIVLETEVTNASGQLVAKVSQTQAFHYPRA